MSKFNPPIRMLFTSRITTRSSSTGIRSDCGQDFIRGGALVGHIFPSALDSALDRFSDLAGDGRLGDSIGMVDSCVMAETGTHFTATPSMTAMRIFTAITEAAHPTVVETVALAVLPVAIEEHTEGTLERDREPSAESAVGEMRAAFPRAADPALVEACVEAAVCTPGAEATVADGASRAISQQENFLGFCYQKGSKV